MNNPSSNISFANSWLRRFSKLTCFATLALIFIGGMVTSTGSGLAVPDWPLSYGTLFPPMIGGVFYEHGHRMAAATVGMLMVCLAIWLGLKEHRKWVRYLGFFALGAVILQGILGGMTVLFFLPTPVSVVHAVLAQTFFVLTIVIAYSLSLERHQRQHSPIVQSQSHGLVIRMALVLAFLVYLQLILGALMRHTGSGLAIPDFPTMGGAWWPRFHEAMLTSINDWRFEHNLEAVTMMQVFIHFIHRVGAVVILLTVCILTYLGLKWGQAHPSIVRTIFYIDALVILQLCLGALTVLTQKAPRLTSLHVMTGASILGMSVLLVLRVGPLSIVDLKQQLFSVRG